jgi:glycosyltransferase involved in cell wall biosynthesis/SAM-dependent methyltransferase
MRIGYVLINFPALSETFIRREILALCRAGHRLFVYTHYRHRDPLVQELQEPNLAIREIRFQHDVSALVRAARTDGVEHLHSSLMIAAHRATHAAARSLQTPFTLTAYSGHDIFTARDPHLYREISADPLCAAIIVEDPFMRDWVVSRLGADPQKIITIANSFDLDLYCLPKSRPPRDRMVILAIARFVEKKGLIYLLGAFNQLVTVYSNAELWLVGDGPEEAHLRRAAGQNSKIKFLGRMSEPQTRRAYVDADIFCLPCIQTARGDADGVPTTVLEAMAFELPIVSSDLLSMPHYVRDGQEGLLVPPRDAKAIANALKTLCTDSGLREALGGRGRVRVSELCDLKRNFERLQSIMVEARWRGWHAAMKALVERRKSYTSATQDFYTGHRIRAINFFQPRGRLLDIGCGQGDIRFHMPPNVTYVGCDPVLLPPGQDRFPFVVALGEGLPFDRQSFDSVLFYSVTSYMFNIDAVLFESNRVLKPGGSIYFHECVNDPNPIHLNHLTDADLRRRVSKHFVIVDSQHDGDHYLLLKAHKPSIAAVEAGETPPLVSIAITAYNRKAFIRECIDSVLNQTYRPVEIVVVDDASTDDTPQILEQYGSKIQMIHNDRNQGIAFSKNLALAKTCKAARYVGVLDSDDYFHPRFIERCVAFLETASNVGLVYTDDICVNAGGRELGRQRAVEPWSAETWVCTCNLRGDTWLARRSLVMQTALHDETLKYDVDYDLFYQLLEITTFAHVPEFLVYIRDHSGRSTRDRLELAKCHAANLVKYGYSPEYAYLRARRNPEWLPAIEEGIVLGKALREKRRQAPSNILNEG